MNKPYHELVFDMFLVNNPYYRDKVIGWEVHGKHTIRINVSTGDLLEFNGDTDTLRLVVDPVTNLTDEGMRKRFAYNLVKMMRKTGHSQQTLSEYTGISQPTISRYLNETSTPSITVLGKFADALQCDIHDLFD